jgi:hypothetical protein
MNASSKWTVISWIDSNNNQLCEDDADIFTVSDLPLGATSLEIAYDGSVELDGVCDRVSGFTNYEPPPNAP